MVTLKLARCDAVRGSSYIPFLEGYPFRRDSILLNIHNGSDDNSFYIATQLNTTYFPKKNRNRELRSSDTGQMFLLTAERTHQPRCRKGTSKCQWAFMTYQNSRTSMKCGSMCSGNKILKLTHLCFLKKAFRSKKKTLEFYDKKPLSNIKKYLFCLIIPLKTVQNSA